MLAREWLHANHKRLVTVKFGPESSIHTVDRKGQKLRTFSLKSVDGITVEKTSVGSQLSTLLRHYILYIVLNEFLFTFFGSHAIAQQ